MGRYFIMDPRNSSNRMKCWTQHSFSSSSFMLRWMNLQQRTSSIQFIISLCAFSVGVAGSDVTSVTGLVETRSSLEKSIYFWVFMTIFILLSSNHHVTLYWNIPKTLKCNMAVRKKAWKLHFLSCRSVCLFVFFRFRSVACCIWKHWWMVWGQ